MTKLTHNLAAKITAIFLFIIFVVGFIAGIFGIDYLVRYDFYGKPLNAVKEDIFEDITRVYATRLFYEYFPAYKKDSSFQTTLEEAFSADYTNFLYTLKKENGELILSNYNNQEVQFSRTYTFQEHGYWEEKEVVKFSEYWEEEELINTTEYVEGEVYTIDCYVKSTLTAEDRYFRAENWIQVAYSMRYTLIIFTILSFIIAIVLFVFLMCSAGHRKGKEEVIPNGLDKIPFDIFLAGILTIAFITVAILDNIYNWTYYVSNTGHLLIMGAVLIMTVPLLLLACMS
ncbi:MAG: hypothetical protein GX783_02080, partial [Clostridiales bacterium]|nr:hypothetical protein [Clostridiales bacterium]